MATVDEQLILVIAKLDGMEKRLFHDNGGECLQSKINRHEQIVAAQERRWKWVLGTTTCLICIVLGRILFEVIW